MATTDADKAKVESASRDKTVRLWDAVTGVALQTLNVGVQIYDLSFSPSGQFLNTDKGMFRLEHYSTPSNSTGLFTALSVIKEWVMKEEERILWLPPDYRATCVAVLNETIVLGHASGQISLLL